MKETESLKIDKFLFDLAFAGCNEGAYKTLAECREFSLNFTTSPNALEECEKTIELPTPYDIDGKILNSNEIFVPCVRISAGESIAEISWLDNNKVHIRLEGEYPDSVVRSCPGKQIQEVIDLGPRCRSFIIENAWFDEIKNTKGEFVSALVLEINSPTLDFPSLPFHVDFDLNFPAITNGKRVASLLASAAIDSGGNKELNDEESKIDENTSDSKDLRSQVSVDKYVANYREEHKDDYHEYESTRSSESEIKNALINMFGESGIFSQGNEGIYGSVIKTLLNEGFIKFARLKSFFSEWVVVFEITNEGHNMRKKEIHRRISQLYSEIHLGDALLRDRNS